MFLGLDAFMSTDRSQVFAGVVWLDKIRQSLEEAELVILMLSKRSVGRAWVNFEAGATWLTRKPIIPVCYGNMSKERLPHPSIGVPSGHPARRLGLPDGECRPSSKS